MTTVKIQVLQREHIAGYLTEIGFYERMWFHLVLLSPSSFFLWVGLFLCNFLFIVLALSCFLDYIVSAKLDWLMMSPEYLMFWCSYYTFVSFSDAVPNSVLPADLLSFEAPFLFGLWWALDIRRLVAFLLYFVVYILYLVRQTCFV